MIKKFIGKLFASAITAELQAQRDALVKESASVLHDITYRMNQLKETAAGIGDRVHTSDLSLATHMIDGYTFTNNHNGTAAAPGYVAWADLNIVYKGTTYMITNGSTNLKYLWWDFSATDKTKLATSATKPTIEADDVLIGVNEGCTFTLTMAPGKLTPGAALLDGSIGSAELGSGAVSAGKIASGAINSSGLFAADVVTNTAIATGAVTSDSLGSGAVTAGKIGAGAINGSTLFGTGVVPGTAVADDAITTAKIAPSAVTSTELGSGAVTAGKIGSGAINASGLFGTGVVASTAIASGAVTETKMNTATHMLF